MAEAVLVEDLIRDGERLVGALDHAGVPVEAAFWYFASEAADWRLMLVSTRVAQRGQKLMYSDVETELRKLQPASDLSLQNITVARRDNQIVRQLRSAIQTGPGTYGIRFSAGSLEPLLGREVYIYRMALTATDAPDHELGFRDQVTDARALFRAESLRSPYWEVVVKPLEFRREVVSLRGPLQEVRTRARVSLRGWDFPHVGRNEDLLKSAFADGVQSVTHALGRHHEAHRIYRSGLFIWRKRLQEEFESGLQDRLMFEGTIYLFTEIVLFASRYLDELKTANGFVSIEAKGLTGRRLWGGRQHGLDMYESATDRFRKQMELAVSELADRKASLALDWAADLFELFGFQADRDVLTYWQNRLLEKAV